MKIDFPFYEGFDPVEVPEKNLVGIFTPEFEADEDSQDRIIQEAIASPIGSPRLRDLVRGDEKIAIVGDDATRPTPAWRILPFLLDELREGGVSDDQIALISANGTHRDMPREELIAKWGEEALSRFRLVHHHSRIPNELTHVGETDNGVQIWLNKTAAESDLVIAMGHVVPHRIAGFSGGGKLLLPGICADETIGGMHWVSTYHTGPELFGNRDNPVRKIIDQAALAGKMKFIVNVVQDNHGRVKFAVAGGVVEAHRKGVELARSVLEVPLPHEADIVIADSHPCNVDLWQASKGIFQTLPAIKPGGTLIFVTPCPEGVSKKHPFVLERGYRNHEQVRDEVNRNGNKTVRIPASHIVHVGEVIPSRGDGIMVSHGISKEETNALGLDFASSPQEAFEMAIHRHGTEASVIVLRRTADMLTVVRDGERAG